MWPLFHVFICTIALPALPQPQAIQLTGGPPKFPRLHPSLFLLYLSVTHGKSFTRCMAHSHEGRRGPLVFFLPGNQGGYSVLAALEVSSKICPSKM